MFILVFYGRELLHALGSFAIGAAGRLFVLGMALAAYSFGFGLNQAERRAMSLAICTRNARRDVRGVHGLPESWTPACS